MPRTLFFFFLVLFSCGPDTGEPLDGSPGGADSAPDGDPAEDAPPMDDATADPSDGFEAGAQDGFVSDGSTPTTRPPEVAPPIAPSWPRTIGTLSVAIRTGDSSSADTDDPQEFCLSEEACFTLDNPDVNDFREGGLDVYHFEGVELARSTVDRVALGTLSNPSGNNNRWTVACLDVRFDGEPVYCQDDLNLRIGTGDSSGEVAFWSDPMGLHQACTTCQGEMLTHGPMQGAHDADTLRVWVRTDATRQVGLRLGTTPDLVGAPVSAWVYPRPEDDFSGVLVAPGLMPGGQYYYRVEIEGMPMGEIRAIQTQDPRSEHTRIGFGSCTKERSQPIFAPVLDDDLDLFVFVGDNHYGNTPHVEAHRYHYRWQRSLPERAELIANVSTISTWDDHDFVGNNTDGTCLGIDDAIRGFEENWANGPRPASRGIYHQHRQGPVEVFMLDCRTHRPSVSSRHDCDTDPDAPTLDRTYGLLGQEQTEWLLSGLEASDAAFKFLACGSRWTRHGSRDSWDSFLDARDRLFDGIDQRGVDGVVLLSGDIHETDLRLVSRDGGYDFPEITSSPLGRPASRCGRGDSERRFCFDDTSSYVVLEADTSVADPTLTASVHDVSGTQVYEWVIRMSELR